MSKTSKAVVGVVVLVVALLAGGAWWFLHDDAPDRVSLDAATRGARGQAGQGQAGQGQAGATGDDAAIGKASAVEGQWVVDTETGDFDWDSATGTFAGFRVAENLANVGAAEAVGRTGEVSGSLEIKGSQVVEADFTVDLASLRTNNNMRDSRVRQALDTAAMPEAKLSLTKPITLPADASSGGKVSAKVAAKLALHGVTREVSLTIDAQLVDGRIVIVGSTPITFSDFDIEVPKSPVVLSVDDHGEMEFQALMKRDR